MITQKKRKQKVKINLKNNQKKKTRVMLLQKNKANGDNIFFKFIIKIYIIRDVLYFQS